MKIGTTEWSNFLFDHAKKIGIDFDHTQNRLFCVHAVELIKWNRKINLTTLTDPIEVASNHFLDSLVPSRLIPPHAAKLLDIGSGGGFPGIPLKVLLPELSVTLIDASRKKVNFLKHVIRTLELENIEALHLRAEDLATQSSYMNRFDVIISRALTSLESFVRLALPLLAYGGIIMAMKGQVEGEELANLGKDVIKKMNLAGSNDLLFKVSLKNYRLPYHYSNRTVVKIG
ncbi:MAG: 16S rRNA (guanine(527)-N(7))-methyltransferase RsmG [Desulfobacterales bacterium]|jgi:16S rRNA (guanine527-N7)-methyltransferase